eukprot:COSAG02_NODE_1641_length_11530_cov_4.345289_2_plen_163_part_00
MAHQSLATPAAVESRLSQRNIRHRLLAAASARSGDGSGILVVLPRSRAEPVVCVFRSVTCGLQVCMVVMDCHGKTIDVERWQVQRVVVLPAETCRYSMFPMFVPSHFGKLINFSKEWCKQRAFFAPTREALPVKLKVHACAEQSNLHNKNQVCSQDNSGQTS